MADPVTGMKCGLAVSEAIDFRISAFLNSITENPIGFSGVLAIADWQSTEKQLILANVQ